MPWKAQRPPLTPAAELALEIKIDRAALAADQLHDVVELHVDDVLDRLARALADADDLAEYLIAFFDLTVGKVVSFQKSSS